MKKYKENLNKITLIFAPSQHSLQIHETCWFIIKSKNTHSYGKLVSGVIHFILHHSHFLQKDLHLLINLKLKRFFSFIYIYIYIYIYICFSKFFMTPMSFYYLLTNFLNYLTYIISFMALFCCLRKILRQK